MRKRTLARILVLAALFQVDVGRVDPEMALGNVLEDLDEEILYNLTQRKEQSQEEECNPTPETGRTAKSIPVMNEFSRYLLDEDFQEFVRESFLGVLAHLDHLDAHIREKAINWDWDRIAKVERNVLRLALYEMLYRKDIPVNVSIDEAIGLAKVFGDRESGRFVNGILGAIKIDEVKKI